MPQIEPILLHRDVQRRKAAPICASQHLCGPKGLVPTTKPPSMTDLSRHTVSHLSSLVKTINLPGKSPTEENWGLVAHQPPIPPIDLQYATICSTNNTNTEHKYAPRCDHEPAELPTAAASIMDLATVSMEPQIVRPCLLPMIRRTPPSSHLLRAPPSSHRRFH